MSGGVEGEAALEEIGLAVGVAGCVATPVGDGAAAEVAHPAARVIEARVRARLGPLVGRM